MKKLLSVWLIVLAMVLFIGCGDKLSISIKDAEKSITLTVGEEKLISPEKTGKGTLVYESSDPSVVEVLQGVITGKAKGSAVVTISFKEDAKVNVKINVEVIEEQSTEIKVTKVEITGAQDMEVNGELQLAAVITPDNATNKEVEWKSSDETIATVANGKVKALKAGKVTITCKALDESGVKGEVEITIKDAEEALEKPVLVGLFNEYALDANVFELVDGQYVLTLVLEEDVETELLVATSKVGSSASGLYALDGTSATAETGKKLYQAGTYVLTYDAETHKTEVDYTEAAVPAEGANISINGTVYDETQTIALVEQDKVTVEVIYLPTDKPVIEGHTFSVSDQTKATITDDGELEVLAAGEFKIYVFVHSAEAEFTFTVNATEKHFVPETIEVVNKSSKVEVGGTAKFVAKVSPERASQEVTWSVSDTSIATIDENGTITGVKTGKVRVIATSKEVATVVGEIEFEVVSEIVVDLNTVLVSPEFVNEYEEVTYDGKTFIVGKNAFTTWADAYAKVNEKGTVILKAGEYSMNDALSKSVTIKGESAESVIIQVKASDGTTKNLDADEIAFEKVTLKGNGGGAGVTGVYFETSENARLISVKNCIVTEMNTFLKITKKAANDIEITIEDSEIGVIGQFIAWLASGMKEFTFTGNTVNAGESGGVTNAAGTLIRTRSGKSYIYNNVFTGTTIDNAGLFESSADAEFVNVMYNVFKDCQKVVKIVSGSEKPINFDNNLYLDADGNVLSSVPEIITGEGVSAGSALASEEARVAGYNDFLSSVLTITYNLDGGVNPEGAPVQFNKGQAVELPNPTKEGYVFKGWFANAEFTGDALVSTPIDATEGITLYAKFVQEIKSSIVADLDGGTCENMPTTYVEGVGVELPTPTREGFAFLGWSTVKGGTDYIKAISKEATGEVKLYANWNNLAPKEMKVGANEEYTTLDDAIKAANDGDKIFVGEGEFTLGVAINSSVTIQGAGSSKTIINVTKNIAGNINADEIVIDSVTLKGTGGGSSDTGVYFQAGANMRLFTVKNSIITSMNTFLKIDGGNNNVITLENNSFDTMGQFLVWLLSGMQEIKFEGNTIDVNTCGAVPNTAAALLRVRSGSAYIANNTFTGDVTGIAALFECGSKATEMKIEDNVFVNVTKYVYINGGNSVVFGENTYLDSEGNILTAVPAEVTGNGVTPGTAKGYIIGIDLDVEDNTTITVTGIVQEVISKGFIIRDENFGVQVTSSDTVAAGDVVRVTGTKTTYKDIAVVTATKVEVVDTGFDTEEAIEMTTAEFVALQNTQENVGKKIILVGTLVESSGYVNFKLDSSNTAYLTLDSSELESFKEYVNCVVKLTVYPLYKTGTFPHSSAARLASLVNLTMYVGEDKEYKALDDAIKAANDGATIVLGEGEFTLGVAINSSVTIQGAGSSKTIINVTKNIAGNINADEIVIDSVTLKGTGGGSSDTGVYFQAGANMRLFTVKNSIITSMNTFLKIDGGNNNVITLENNSFDTMGQFLVWLLSGMQEIKFEGNTIDVNTCGAVPNTAAALLRVRSGSAYIANNTFTGDVTGIAALFECGSKATEMKIEDNVFVNVTKYVYINGGNSVVFGENIYVDAEGNVLTAVPETVTGKGVTPGTANDYSLELDFSTKEAKNSNYSNTWQYGDFTIKCGANNNAGWAFVKIGGKKETLANYSDCYIKSDVATAIATKKVTVYTNKDNLKYGSVKSWKLEVYSDAECTQLVETIDGEEMKKGEAQELVFSATTSWQAGCYFKIVFELENTTGSNGIVWIEKVVIK